MVQCCGVEFLVNARSYLFVLHSMVVVFHGKLELSQILRVINTYSSKPFLTPNYSGSSSGRGGNIGDLPGLKFMA